MDTGSSKTVVIPSPFRGLHVLLVDHDRQSLKYIASLLEEQSYHVTATEGAMVAMSMIKEKKGHYDLILVHINVEEMDCFRLIKEIAVHNLPTIMMASGEHMDIVEKIVKEYSVNFLRKPCRAKDILNVWQHAARHKRRIHFEETMQGNIVEQSNCNEKDGVKLIKPPPAADTAIELYDKQGHGDKNGRGTREGNYSNTSNMGEGERKKTKKKRCITSRITWTPALHLRFIKALKELGLKSHPKALLRKMNVPFLTHRHVASHLQKYRARIKYQQSEKTRSAQSLVGESVFNSSRGYGSTPEPCKFSPAVPAPRPGLTARDGTYLTLGTLEDKLQFAEYTPRTINHDQVWGKGKLPLEYFKRNTQTSHVVTSMIPSDLNPLQCADYQNSQTSTRDFGTLDGLEHSNAFPGQREEKNFSRDIGDGASNSKEIIKGVTMGSTCTNKEQASLAGLDTIIKFLEGEEDFENFGDLKGDDIDRYSEWLWSTSDFS